MNFDRIIDPRRLAAAVQTRLDRWRRHASRGRHEGWARYPAPPLTPLPGLADAVRRTDGPTRARLELVVEKLLAGRFATLGRVWPRQAFVGFPAELWRLDPATGRHWPGPETYGFDIDLTAADEIGDVEYVLALNRLDLLQPLAAHAALTRDAAALATIEQVIASWHAANPPFRGIGWTTGRDIALRAINLALVFSLVGPLLSGASHRRIGEIAAASAFWLQRFPTRPAAADHALVAELAARYVLRLLFSRPRPRELAALGAEILRQFHPDGTPAEQSPAYGALSAELGLFAAFLARAGGSALPRAVLDRLEAFADFVGSLGAPTPRYGDDAECRLLAFGDDEDYPRAVAAAIHGFLTRPGIAPAMADLRAALFGAAPAIRAYPKGLDRYPYGGLSIWRGRMNAREVRLVLDHGPLGHLPRAAHGHADALQLLLDLDGRPVLVDPGSYLFASGGVWRRWFRTTPAHNTLNLDRQSQSPPAGPFGWTHHAEARLDETAEAPNTWLRMSHDGYQSRFGRRHQRTVQIEPGRLSVTDQLLGGAPLSAEIVFQLAPDLEAAVAGQSVIVTRDGMPLLHIDFPDANITVTTGGDTPGAGGWVSPRFGVRLPALRLAWHGEVGEGAVTTWLTPLTPRRPPQRNPATG